MGRTTKPLTNTEVDKAKPADKVRMLSDGNGLYFRITPSNSRTWLFKYQKPYTKARTNIGLGSYPQVSLKLARMKADEYRALLAQNIDPKSHRDDVASATAESHLNTLKKVTADWLVVKRSTVSADHGDDIERSLQKNVLHKLGKLPITHIKPAEVIRVLKPMDAAGKHETLRRVCQRLNEIMNYATNVGLLDHNPLSGIAKAFIAPTKKNLPTIRPEELPQFIDTLKESRVFPLTRYLILWQLHTMVRPSEAVGARWDEIDRENAVWVIPAERMKAKREHKVPLTEQTLALLDKLESITGHTAFLFPAERDDNKPRNSETANAAIKRMGYGGRLVAHGLRSIASTYLNEAGFEADLVEAALAHKDPNEVRSAYNRADYLERRRELMREWSNQIEGRLT